MSVANTAVLSGTVTWSDSTLFNGYVLLGLALPSNAAGDFPTVSNINLSSQRLPVWVMVKITDGVFDQNAKLFYNSSLTPPGSKYVAYWYDRGNRLIYPAAGVAGALFTISTNPHAISLPTLTIPTMPATAPLPATGA